MKNKIILGVIVTLIIFSVVIALSLADLKPKNVGSKKIKVVTTLFPLYDMAKNMGGDKAEVFLLLPPGVEAHTFEPKPSDIVKINQTDIFVYTGKFMEPWAEDIVNGIVNKNLIVVNASKGTKMIPGVFHDEDEPVGSLDPHIWLDFDNAKIIAQNIAEAMEAKDPANKVFYKQNADDYNNKLTKLDISYRAVLSTCKNKEIIYAGHYAFGYLANRYGIKYLAAQGVSPDSEPTAKDLIKLVEQIKNDKIKYVFYEELTSSKIAETIAKETNAKMLLLNAAHNLTKEQFEQDMSFFEILNANLENLKIGLECK